MNPTLGLADLHALTLTPAVENRLQAALLGARGPTAWRRRKEAEARDVLALEAIASRLTVEALDLETEMRAVLRLRCAVPCLLDAEQEMVVAGEAVLGLRYGPEAVRVACPGTDFLSIFAPRGVWHPNVARGPDQRLCLGTHLMAGIPVRELVLAAYGALTLQAVQLDVTDSAGVLNHDAALWWQERAQSIPLSRVPFLGDADLSRSPES